ncbi:MAG: phage major capsid protein, partial [Kiritimatiellae bacterium]|nr:phage major capsid protein [Kiritimatiellia bacterium]
MTIIELRAKRNKAWEAAKAFAETHMTDRGTLSVEDEATYNKLEAEISDLSREIARRERQEALDAELSKPVNTPITEKPMSGKQDGEKKTGRASDEYKAAILNALRSNFRQISNVLSEGVDANGGY